MSGTIVWRRAGVVLLMWLLITVLGIVLFVMSSQFSNAGYEKVTDGNVTSYEVDLVPCNKGSGSCYNAYAQVRFDSATRMCILFSNHNANQTRALAEVQAEYPVATQFDELFREVGTHECFTGVEGENMAIAGVVLLSVSGLILVLLPLYYPYLLASMTTTGEVMSPGKVQVSEIVAPTTVRTKKEEIEAKQAEVVAKARTKSIRMSKQQSEALAAKRRGEAEGGGLGRLFSIGV